MSDTASVSTPNTTATAQPGQGGRNPNQNLTKGNGKTPAPQTGDNLNQSSSGQAEEPKRYKFEKLKFKGKEIDFEGDENEVKRVIMRGLGSDEAYHEAKRMREEAEKREARLWEKEEQNKKEREEYKKNPVLGIKKAIQTLIDAGVHPQEARRAVEAHLYEEIQRDEMSEDARRAYALEEENKKLALKIENDKKLAEEAELNKHAIEQRKIITTEMLKSMDALGLAKTAQNLASVARRLQMANKLGRKMSIPQAVELTHQDNQSYVKSTTSSYAQAINEAYRNNDTEHLLAVGKELEGFLGEEAVVALQRYGIVKIKNRVPNMPQQIIDAAKTKTSSSPAEEKTLDEIIEERKARAAELDRQRGLRGAAS